MSNNLGRTIILSITTIKLLDHNFLVKSGVTERHHWSLINTLLELKFYVTSTGNCDAGPAT